MKIAIDIVLLLVLIWGVYNGYKRGLVNVIIALFATCLAIFAGSILSATYSGTLMPAFEPFVAGLADTVEEQTLADIGYGNSVVNMNELIKQQPEMKQKYCKALYMEMGIHEGRAEKIAEEAAQLVDTKDMKLENAAVQTLSEKLLYVLGTALAAVLILILFTAFVNLVNLSFHLHLLVPQLLRRFSGKGNAGRDLSGPGIPETDLPHGLAFIIGIGTLQQVICRQP